MMRAFLVWLAVLPMAWSANAFAQDYVPGNGNRGYYEDAGFRLSDERLVERSAYRSQPGQAMRPTHVTPVNQEVPTPAPRVMSQPVASPRESLPLTPRRLREPSNENSSKAQTPTRAVTTVFASLAIVLGLFVLVVWVTRRTRPKGSMSLPKEVVQVLGRVPLAARQQLHLVRLGNKLLLLSVTANGSETLSEITDVDEVERLAGICQQNQPGSITATFRQVLLQLGSNSTNNEIGSIEPASGNPRSG